MLLQPMVTRLKRQPDLPSALETVCRDIVALHGAEFGHVQIVGEDGYLWLVGSTGFSERFLAAVGRLAPDAGTVCTRAWSTRENVLIRDVATDPVFKPFLQLARETGFRAVLSSPIVSSEGQLIGVVSAHFANPRVPTAIELETRASYCREVADHLLSRCDAPELTRQAQALHRAMIGRVKRDAESERAALPPPGPERRRNSTRRV
jgi:GAF domain-containing protein